LYETSAFLFTYFASVIAVIALDFFIGTTLIQFHKNCNNHLDIQETIANAAMCWGLLNWLLSIFLLFNGLNYLIINLLKSPLVSCISKMIILFSSATPYFLFILQEDIKSFFKLPKEISRGSFILFQH